MSQALQQLYQQLDYQPREPGLFVQAITHRSFAREHNERLEFLGDAILDLLIGEALYQQLPDKPEGELSRFRAELVKGSHLAEMARQIQLGSYLRLGDGERKNGGERRDSILAGAFEALFGALYLDGGLDAARQLAQQIFAGKLADIEAIADKKDSKTALQECLQAQQQGLPQYQLMEASGKQHQQWFVVECAIAAVGLSVTAGGSSKKQAEQKAAEKMLCMLQKEMH